MGFRHLIIKHTNTKHYIMNKSISPRFLKTYCKIHLLEVKDATECSRHRNNLLRRNAIMYWYYEHYKNDLPKSALYEEIGSIFQMSRVNCFEQIRNFDFFLYRIKKEYSVIYDSVCQTLKPYCREDL